MPDFERTAPKLLTPSEFKGIMESWDVVDTEVRHIEADEVMVALLRALGYDEGLDIYESWTRWHA